MPCGFVEAQPRFIELGNEGLPADIGFRPEYLSADGRSFTGYMWMSGDDFSRAFVWSEADGFTELKGQGGTVLRNASPRVISDDGSKIIGVVEAIDQPPGIAPFTAGEMFVWEAGLGARRIGVPELRGSFHPLFYNQGTEIIYGRSHYGDESTNFLREEVFYRWSESSGFEVFDFADYNTRDDLSDYSFVQSTSVDGRYVYLIPSQYFRDEDASLLLRNVWTQRPHRLDTVTGEVIALIPEDANIRSGYVVSRTSQDGGSAAGYHKSSFWHSTMFYWSEEDGFTQLLDTDGESPVRGAIRAMSGDGRVVAGRSYRGYAPPFHFDFDFGFIWTKADGFRFLREAWEAEGVDAWDRGWSDLHIIDISYDGTVFIGYGDDPQGNEGYWMVILPEPAFLPWYLAGAALLTRKSTRSPGGFV